jgi:hypothetical protein
MYEQFAVEDLNQSGGTYTYWPCRVEQQFTVKYSNSLNEKLNTN